MGQKYRLKTEADFVLKQEKMGVFTDLCLNKYGLRANISVSAGSSA
jgi:hypothetical protein